jgi:hypothetical protein
MTIKKRGRPAGSKNKKPVLSIYKKGMDPISDFQKTLNEWDQMEDKTDWELIAIKQEDRLKAYIAENEELAKICVMRWEEIQHLKYLVTYLERKNEDSSV